MTTDTIRTNKIKGIDIWDSKDFCGYNTSDNYGDHNNCVTLALAACIDADYDEAFALSKLYFNREHSVGTRPRNLRLGMERLRDLSININNHKVTEIELRNAWSGIRANNTKVYTWIQNHCDKRGKYMIVVRGHAFAVVDGIIIDACLGRWGRNGTLLNCTIQGIFKIEKI